MFTPLISFSSLQFVARAKATGKKGYKRADPDLEEEDLE